MFLNLFLQDQVQIQSSSRFSTQMGVKRGLSGIWIRWKRSEARCRLSVSSDVTSEENAAWWQEQVSLTRKILEFLKEIQFFPGSEPRIQETNTINQLYCNSEHDSASFVLLFICAQGVLVLRCGSPGHQSPPQWLRTDSPVDLRRPGPTDLNLTTAAEGTNFGGFYPLNYY